MDAWVKELSRNPGSAADNFIIALSYMDAGFDREACANLLAQELVSGREDNPSSIQRMALALIACGGIDMIPDGLADDTIGELGVMSYIFGLHLLNNGVPSDKWTREAIIDKLTELRKSDGGWAVTGQYGDVDATAMCIQALVCYDSERDVGSLVGDGISFLASRQKDDAGFASFGVENAESAAQVVMALTAAGVNPSVDERFCKNGRTVIDAMLDYCVSPGAYAHTAGGGASDMASVQVLQALLCMEMMKPMYDFSAVKAVEAHHAISWKIYAWIIIAAAALVGCCLSLIKKRGRSKRVLFVLIAAAIAAAGVWFINIESAENYYSAPAVTDPAGSVYLSIRCDTVAGGNADAAIPENGEILPRTQLEFMEGDSVFDVLTRAVRQGKLHMEYEGASPAQAYVKGINYLYELAHGDLSGWVFSVNGVTSSVGAGSRTVKDGDEIIWAYTTELGEDLK